MKSFSPFVTVARGWALVLIVCMLGLSACGPDKPSQSSDKAASRASFRVAWSIYVGWMPWGYAQDAGIVDKWAGKYGIDLKLVQINDYVESVNQYTAGKFDGVTAASMDALTIPAAGGVDTTALIIGDYSNGNDGVVLKGKSSLADIKGQRVNLPELSVSHYLLARALQSAGLSERDVTVVNTSDADIVAAYQAQGTTAVSTWNPQLAAILASPDAKLVFDSSKIPGEILDLLVVNTETLKQHPELGKALTGIWYETAALLVADSPQGKAAREAMARMSGTDLDGYQAQLRSTYLLDTPQKALAFMRDPALKESIDRVRTFSFDHGLFGADAKDKDFVGIALGDGSTLGDPANIKLRFDPQYVELAADGKL
ncbi:putative ABC transporter substrate-binding protein [Pseudoxanthomonas spadix BD-a59]|uniref:ABC transporter substrate-binding protein n=1 Tax=Pseudoxanthomonas spadix (strain BD-a59) TaxID=1045855 RepID=G7UTK2_PSEUP|nr:putative urea ABC transporter substrate-binding protein [Pseudoxanthomonas spadix]AER54903.1 putative ABC transporter substrate-binding protein [Pseudoxanthomonas spadix BD-a59]